MPVVNAQKKPHLSYNILIAEDDVLLAKTIIRKLKECSNGERILLAEPSCSFNFTHKENALSSLAYCKKYKPEVCILDLSIDNSIGPKSGLNLIKDISRFSPDSRVIVLTGHGEDKFGIEALKTGAISFNQKPIQISDLFILIRDATEFYRLKLLKRESEAKEHLGQISLSSKNSEMKKVIELASFAASSRQSVLITGETGTGKGLFAREIHKAYFQTNSKVNKNASFIRFQPSFDSQDLVNSELFGHLKGAFTGASSDKKGLIELASGGSLFIDEVSFLSEKAQVSLLETLQEKTFRKVGSTDLNSSDFKLVSATNTPIDELVAPSNLRKDFYHRISQLKIHLPALRNRPEDILDLANYFLNNLSSNEKLQVHSISPFAEEKLLSYSWPGNVRELMSKIESAAWYASYKNRTTLELEDLDLDNQTNTSISIPITTDTNKNFSLNEEVSIFKMKLVSDSLKRNNGNQSLSAKELGISRSSLRRILGKE